MFSLMLPFSICLLFTGYRAKPALKLSVVFFDFHILLSHLAHEYFANANVLIHMTLEG